MARTSKLTQEHFEFIFLCGADGLSKKATARKIRAEFHISFSDSLLNKNPKAALAWEGGRRELEKIAADSLRDLLKKGSPAVTIFAAKSVLGLREDELNYRMEIEPICNLVNYFISVFWNGSKSETPEITEAEILERYKYEFEAWQEANL